PVATCHVDAIWYRLNIWTQQGERWLLVDHRAACSAATDEGELRGEPCYAGCDLASTSDLCAFVLFFPSCSNAILPYFWVPKRPSMLLSRRVAPPMQHGKGRDVCVPQRATLWIMT